MTTYHLHIAANAEELARQTAEHLASTIDLALAERDRAHIALAGGSTPRAAYLRLGAEHLPWDRVDVLLGDERWVIPPAMPGSSRSPFFPMVLAVRPVSIPFRPTYRPQKPVQRPTPTC
jgi:6-phosphogluconolactonase